jgi:hypothetical protein
MILESKGDLSVYSQIGRFGSETTFHFVIFSFSLQYVTEKMGGAEGTKLDLDFMEMERVRRSFCFLFVFRAKLD